MNNGTKSTLCDKFTYDKTINGTRIILAETAGFCFGVSRAVEIAENILSMGKKAVTLGPIIHNPQMVNKLAEKGCVSVDSVSDAPEDAVVVIRSHGVSADVYDQIKQNGNELEDATCPFVEKIHRIVNEKSKQGYNVIIAGDKNHPEVIGICGHCVCDKNNGYFVVENADQLEQLYKNNFLGTDKKAILIAQTTYNKNLWKKNTEITEKLYTNVEIFDTICSATTKRQQEAESLSKKCDLMIVIGGHDSSNTKKLAQICSENCKTLHIQTKDELKNEIIRGSLIGVTAGASTPAYIIKEALNTMEEKLLNHEEELDFAQLLEQSLETEKLYTGKRVKGIVTTIAPNEIHVDINAKQAGIVSASELTDDPTAKIEDIVKKGDEIDLVVLKVNDQEGLVMLSKKRCDAQAGFDAIKKAAEEGQILDGVITDVVRGGVLVFTNNTKVFVPASQVSLQRVENLETLLKQPVRIKILEVNDKRMRALASVKAVLLDEKKERQAKFWEEVEEGKEYTGEVKSLTQYGAFVDLGGVDGMIHVTELSWVRIKHPSQVVNVGDTVKVYIKELDRENKRISLGYRRMEDNPWEIFKANYKDGDVVDVTIVSFTTYGAFARIIPGIDGLIHISQIANQRVEKISDFLKVGQQVQAKIIEINLDEKRVSLSIRALLPEEDKEAAAEETASDAE